MKYRLTPLNLLCALMIGQQIVWLISPPASLGAAYLRAYTIPIIFIGVLLDLALQWRMKKHNSLIIFEFSLMILGFILLQVS